MKKAVIVFVSLISLHAFAQSSLKYEYQKAMNARTGVDVATQRAQEDARIFDFQAAAKKIELDGLTNAFRSKGYDPSEFITTSTLGSGEQNDWVAVDYNEPFSWGDGAQDFKKIKTTYYLTNQTVICRVDLYKASISGSNFDESLRFIKGEIDCLPVATSSH